MEVALFFLPPLRKGGKGAKAICDTPAYNG